MKLLLIKSLVCIVLLSNTSYSQTKLSGCDFFPDKDVILYSYDEQEIFGKRINEVKYVFDGNVTINNKTYKAYNKYVNGFVPEVNKVLYVSCSENSLVMGHAVYEYNSELVGYRQDITKIIDINATPIYNTSMEPTGFYFLPIVLKPNSPVGESWTDLSFLNGQKIEIISKMIKRDFVMDVQGKPFSHVYQVDQEVWALGINNKRNKILEVKNYYAKGVGMIKTTRTVYVGDYSREMVTELYNEDYIKQKTKEKQIPVGRDQIVARLGEITIKIGNIDMNDIYQNIRANKNNIPLDKLKIVLEEFEKIDERYEKEITDETNRVKKLNSEFSKIESRFKDQGTIDQSMIGIWKEMERGRYFYKFYADGMVETYMDTPEERNLYYPKHLWRMFNNNTLETLFKHLNGTNEYTLEKYILKKSKDIKTGVQIITFTPIDQSNTIEKTFIKVD